ncbi:unnamed protein product [Linum trigynum]|uniref:Uncharacterized protein n=1 Tax=Linum trigynum TaxID=586398 RepID=A0AAV2CPU9_9ROSI
MQVSVISTESIRPWSSSAGRDNEFKPFKLCLLDQLMFSTHAPVVLFYPMKEAHHPDEKMVARWLKESLSKTLNPFYPVAGRVKDNLVIHDFEKGVPFTEARVKGHSLSDVLTSPRGGGGPKLEFLNNLLPFEPFCQGHENVASGSHAQVSVQLNTFDCGGIAIGINLYHKLMDGATTSAFLHTWGANCSNDPQLKKQPELHKASSVFPPSYSIPIESQTFSDRMLFEDVGGRRRRQGASRRFVFDEKAIAILRTKAGLSVLHPTRLEALSAFIWESALRATAAAGDAQQLMFLMQGVNMRQLMSPRLSKHSLGNLVATAMASCVDSSNRSMEELVRLIRDGNLRVDENYLNVISGDQGFPAMMQGQKFLQEITRGFSRKTLACSSWVGFGFNNFDFGWGKPIWSGLFGDPSGEHPFMNNTIIFKEVAARGHGSSKAIEAWIRLDEDVMARLEHDPHFTQYASPNPPIILD